MPRLTRDEKCEWAVRTLRVAPACGLSLKEIQDIAWMKDSLEWSLLDINEILCWIRPQIKHEKVKRKHGKVTLFALKDTKQP